MTPMEKRRLVTVGVVACAIVAALLAAIPRAATTLPARLTDHEFWQLSTDASEPDGYFRSDNLTSNETGFLRVVNELVDAHEAGAGVSRRRARAEFQLHRGDQAGTRDHLRHPPRQSCCSS